MNSQDEDTVEVLKDVRRWLKFANLEEARSKVHEAVSDEDDENERENKIIYHLSDGEHSQHDIADLVSVSQKTVSRRQTKWANMGLLEKPAPNIPYRQLITLEEVGLGVPDIPERKGGNDD